MPDADDPMLPTNTAAPGVAGGEGLDDLERRLAAFENATKRLNRTVTGAEDPAPPPPQRPATRRLSDSGLLRGEEISGLRPAVASQGPQTGALTARARGVPNTGSAGFTSAFGKPTIPQPAMTATLRTPVSDVQAPASTRRVFRRLTTRQILIGVAIGLGIITVTVFAALPRMFPGSAEGVIMARSTVVASSMDGIITDILATPGSRVRFGDKLALISDSVTGASSAVVAPNDGTISGPILAAGRQVRMGQPMFDLALPGEPFAVSSMSPASLARIAVGDRAEIQLLSEGRIIDGTISEVVPAGATQASGLLLDRDARPRILVSVDPSPVPPQLGQGARIMVLGPRPGPVRLILLKLRRLMPW